MGKEEGGGRGGAGWVGLYNEVITVSCIGR